MLSYVYKYAYIFFIYINKLSFGNAIFFWRDYVLWDYGIMGNSVMHSFENDIGCNHREASKQV